MRTITAQGYIKDKVDLRPSQVSWLTKHKHASCWMFGKIVNAEVEAMERISRRELLIFAPLTVLVLWFGIYPASLLDVMETSIQVVLDSAAAGGAFVIAGR